MPNDRANRIFVRVIQQFKALRIAEGMSHENVAQKTGVTRPAISLIESGKRKPSLLVSLRLASALGKNLSDIIRNAEENEKPK